MLADIKADLSEDQQLYLNPWLDFSFLVRNNSGSSFLAGLMTALLGSLVGGGAGTSDFSAYGSWVQQFISRNMLLKIGLATFLKSTCEILPECQVLFMAF